MSEYHISCLSLYRLREIKEIVRENDFVCDPVTYTCLT